MSKQDSAKMVAFKILNERSCIPVKIAWGQVHVSVTRASSEGAWASRGAQTLSLCVLSGLIHCLIKTKLVNSFMSKYFKLNIHKGKIKELDLNTCQLFAEDLRH